MTGYARFAPKTLPYRCVMTCGCVIRLSRRQRMRGEHYCPRHRTIVAVAEALQVVPRTKPGQAVLSGWDQLESNP